MVLVAKSLYRGVINGPGFKVTSKIPAVTKRRAYIRRTNAKYFWINNGKDSEQHNRCLPIPKGWIKGKISIRMYPDSYRGLG